MTKLKALIVVVCLMAVLPAFAADPKPVQVNPADSKDHIGELAIVCGKVVGNFVAYNGVGGRGFPVKFFLDQPEASAVFYFMTFPGEGTSGETHDPQKLVATYQGKHVCVTGKILKPQSSSPYIIAPDASKIKIQDADK